MDATTQDAQAAVSLPADQVKDYRDNLVQQLERATAAGTGPMPADQVKDYRDNLVQQLERATAAGTGPMPANLVCQRERNLGLAEGLQYALDHFDELLADVQTFALASADDSQTGY